MLHNFTQSYNTFTTLCTLYSNIYQIVHIFFYQQPYTTFTILYKTFTIHGKTLQTNFYKTKHNFRQLYFLQKKLKKNPQNYTQLAQTQPYTTFRNCSKLSKLCPKLFRISQDSIKLLILGKTFQNIAQHFTKFRQLYISKHKYTQVQMTLQTFVVKTCKKHQLFQDLTKLFNNFTRLYIILQTLYIIISSLCKTKTKYDKPYTQLYTTFVHVYKHYNTLHNFANSTQLYIFRNAQELFKHFAQLYTLF